MRTIIPTTIATEEEAKFFLQELHKNEESYHPEENASDIVNLDGERLFNDPEAEQLNTAIEQCFGFEGFDPCEFLLDLTIGGIEE